MITTETTIQEMVEDPRFESFSSLLLSNCRVPDQGWTFREMNDHFYDWAAESIVYGLNRLEKNIGDGVRVFYDLYTEEEKAAEPLKRETGLFFFPGEPMKPYVIVCPGGGYASVCTIKEGFPVASHLNDLGYNAFVLCYQVRPMEKEQETPLLPGPMEDFARAMQLIRKNREGLRVRPESYGAAGFSSGGHLAGIWGTSHLGAKKYGFPQPSVLFLGYAALDTSLYPAFHGRNILMEGMFGQNYSEEDGDLYNVNLHIDREYPPTYLWHCKDDEIIPVETARRMNQRLEENGILHICRIFLHGGHGFGAGEYTEARHWIAEAVSFWESLGEFA